MGLVNAMALSIYKPENNTNTTVLAQTVYGSVT